MSNLYLKKRTRKLILSLISLLAFFIVTPAMAISEYELFQEGYDLYLSCEPAKASEKFELFLREFPDSSARDSVLFWLGKALMQLGRSSESERVFGQLRKDFPNSSFSYYAGKELDRIKSLVRTSGRRISTEGVIDKEIENIKEERDRFKNLFEEEKKKYERGMAEFDLAIKGKRDLEERIKELEGKVQNSTEDLRRAKEEKDRLIAELKKEIEKKEEIKVIAKDKGDLERKVGILEKDIAGKTEELKKVTKEKEKMGRELVEIKDKLAKLEGDCKEAERTRVQLIEREKEIEGLKAGIEKQQEERKRLTTEMEGLKGEKEKILTELNKAIEKARVMEEEMERLRISQEERQKEITLLKNRIAELSKREVEVAKERDIAKNEVLELQKKIKEMETNIDKIAEERDRLRLLLSEEKRKIDEVSSQIAILRQREKELLDLNATIKGVMEGRLLEIGQKLQVCERDVVSLQNERISRETASEELKRSVESLNAEVLRLRGFESEARNFQAESNRYIERINELERLIENSKKEDAGLRSELMKRDEEISRLIRDKKDLEKNLSELKDKVKGQGYKTLVIGDEKISPNHISSYMFRSQLTLGRLGIKEIPWRKGDLYEDFIGEHILYEEAKRINLKGKDNEGFNKLSLSKEDMEYLNRFNLITNLINHEIRKLSPERSAEAVVLRYSDDDRNEKAAMVVDVQNQIKAGLSVKDVVRSFSKSEYMTFSDKDINELFGDLSGYFSDNEVASTFNKDRFIVLKIKIRPLEYRPYESPSEDTIRMLREYVSMLIATLRSKRDVRFSD